MLFFFTGTGNSLYAAKAIADKGEEIIDMSDLYSQKECSFKVPEGENVGFVFPVYFSRFLMLRQIFAVSSDSAVKATFMLLLPAEEA